jgi:hypothetical protein
MLHSRNGTTIGARWYVKKVQLLEELTEAGLKADQYADFLFFDFHRINKEDHVDIDVIAARQTPLEDGASSYKYIDLFQRMANKAEKRFRNGDSVESFVDDLSFEWNVKIAWRRL